MPYVDEDILEIIAHKFWDYKMARGAWDLSIGIINRMKASNNQMRCWRELD